MNKIITYSLFVLLFFASCKSSKTFTDESINGKINNKTFFKNVLSNDFQFSFLQAKTRMSFNDGTMNQSFTANIRMQQNEIIWLSLTGPFGIEGARVYITQDSIQIIDKLNKKYYKEPFSYLNQYIPFDLDFQFLQNLIIGSAFDHQITKQNFKIQEQQYVLSEEYNGIESTYYFNPQFKYEKIAMNDKALQREIAIQYNDYVYTNDQLFSMLRLLAFQEPGRTINLEMNFTKVKKEESLTFPFNVPNYQ